MSTSSDPRVMLDDAPMGRMQVIAVALCVVLNALDGFDVLSISFAAPGIAAEWGINRAALGVVLSMELIGMGVGSVLLGNLADKVGRRGVILCCLGVMVAGMGSAPFATGVVSLSVIRLITGLGIGGMLASINAMAAEYSNRKNRALSVTLMAAGYSMGAIIGGSIASLLLQTGGWRDVFALGALLTAALIPLVWLFLPESIGFLVEKRPADALAWINRTLARMGHAAIDALPPPDPLRPAPSMRSLFSPVLLRTTLVLTIAYFAHIMTFYFLTKWIPKIVVDLGYPASSAGQVLVWANVGGLAGGLVFGVLSRYLPLRPMVVAVLAASAVAVIWFGQGQDSLARLAMVAAIAGLFTSAGVFGLYGLLAQGFPTEVRAGGTGFVIGLGRGGAALGPIAAGALFASGGSLALVCTLMALGSMIGAITILGLRGKPVAADAAVA